MNSDGVSIRRLTKTPGISVAGSDRPAASASCSRWTEDGPSRIFVMNADSCDLHVVVGGEQTPGRGAGPRRPADDLEAIGFAGPRC
jgi:hypothetical protein